MILILDFDDTLLNTGRLEGECALHMLTLKYGVTNDNFKKAREKLREVYPESPAYYDLKKHLEILSGNNCARRDEMHREVYKLIRAQLKDFLFDDVVAFLKKQSQNHTLILMTFGDPDFQKHKVASSGISHFFHELIFTGKEPKAEIIKRVCAKTPKKEKVVFLDDRVWQLSSAKKMNPLLTSVRIKRKEGRYNHEEGFVGCHEVADMGEFSILLNL